MQQMTQAEPEMMVFYDAQFWNVDVAGELGLEYASSLFAHVHATFIARTEGNRRNT
jgi:hypothetical protein